MAALALDLSAELEPTMFERFLRPYQEQVYLPVQEDFLYDSTCSNGPLRLQGKMTVWRQDRKVWLQASGTVTLYERRGSQLVVFAELTGTWDERGAFLLCSAKSPHFTVMDGQITFGPGSQAPSFPVQVGPDSRLLFDSGAHKFAISLTRCWNSYLLARDGSKVYFTYYPCFGFSGLCVDGVHIPALLHEQRQEQECLRILATSAESASVVRLNQAGQRQVHNLPTYMVMEWIEGRRSLASLLTV